MATNLRIRFAGGKDEIRRSWVPVMFQLRVRGSKKTSQYIVEDFESDIKDDPAQGDSYFEIRNLKKGTYEFKVLALQAGQPLLRRASLSLKNKEKDYRFGPPVAGRIRALKQVNVRGMDVVADAPYRLERSCPYLPLIVFMKDVAPETVQVKSIQISIFSQSAGNGYVPITPSDVYEVIDSDGIRVEKNGRPAFLRFDAGDNYETVKRDPWYRMIFLHKDQLEVTTGKHLIYRNARYVQYRVEVEYIYGDPKRRQFTFRTLLPECDLPRVDDWYYGDNHYHSEFTDNPAEYGGPLSMTAKVAKAMGFSWVTVTDHSYCLSHPKTQEEKEQGNRWLSYKKAVQETNETQKDVLLIGAEEITFSRPIIGLHLLSFGNPFVEDTSLAGFGSLTLEEVLRKITENGTQSKGFLFAAHPASSGYTWEGHYYDVVTNPKWGNVFAGLQLFNEKILYDHTTSAGDEDIEPFELLGESSRQRPWSKELREGLKNHWIKRFLVPSLQEFRKSGNLRKYMILAGSDAHMDFNYSLRPKLPFFLDHLNDNAFGKVRSLVYLPKQDGQALTENNLYEALRNGRTLLTDGPIVLFHLKIEGENRVYRFGETVSLSPGKNLELSLEWQSTPEFGPVQTIKLILGTRKGEKDITDQIRLPSLRKKGIGFDGQMTHLFTNWAQTPCYLRLQAASMIDSKTGEGLFGCFTNPIWIVAG